MILNRIQPYVDPLVSWTQNGIRKSRSTLYNIITLRRIIKGIKHKNLILAMVFIDFSKAFLTLFIEIIMFQIPPAYGIPESIIRAIRLINEDSCAKVVTPDGDTHVFDILAGTFQGDTLVPFLFILVLDYSLRQAYNNSSPDTGILIEHKKGSMHPEVRICDSSYADDISLLNKTLQQAEHLLHCVENAAATVGLHLNVSKTKC